MASASLSYYSYYGCVAIDPVSFVSVTPETPNSPELCADLCYDYGYPYLAVSSQYCACSSVSPDILTLYANVNNGDCYFSCDDANSTYFCGGLDSVTFGTLYNLWGPPVLIDVPPSSTSTSTPDATDSVTATTTVTIPSILTTTSTITPLTTEGPPPLLTPGSSSTVISELTSTESTVVTEYGSTLTTTTSSIPTPLPPPDRPSVTISTTSTTGATTSVTVSLTAVRSFSSHTSSLTLTGTSGTPSVTGSSNTSAASAVGSHTSATKRITTASTATTLSGAPIITRTLFSTDVITITSCASTVTHCPLRHITTAIVTGTTCYPAQPFTSVVHPASGESTAHSSVIYYDTSCSSVATSYSTISHTSARSTWVTVSEYECLVSITPAPLPVSAHSTALLPVSAHTTPTGLPVPAVTAGAQPAVAVAKALAAGAALGVLGFLGGV